MSSHSTEQASVCNLTGKLKCMFGDDGALGMYLEVLKDVDDVFWCVFAIVVNGQL